MNREKVIEGIKSVINGEIKVFECKEVEYSKLKQVLIDEFNVEVSVDLDANGLLIDYSDNEEVTFDLSNDVRYGNFTFRIRGEE